jgi:hypothetical protein
MLLSSHSLANNKASYRDPAWFTFNIAPEQEFFWAANATLFLLVTNRSSPVMRHRGLFLVSVDIPSKSSSCNGSSAYIKSYFFIKLSTYSSCSEVSLVFPYLLYSYVFFIGSHNDELAKSIPNRTSLLAS